MKIETEPLDIKHYYLLNPSIIKSIGLNIYGIPTYINPFIEDNTLVLHTKDSITGINYVLRTVLDGTLTKVSFLDFLRHTLKPLKSGYRFHANEKTMKPFIDYLVNERGLIKELDGEYTAVRIPGAIID